MTASPAMDLDTLLTSTRERRLADYLDLLRIPSISGLPEHAGDCHKAAEWLADHLRSAGLEHVEVSETGGHPIVYADWLHAEGAPTAVAYAHYDVQPVDPLDEWRRPPFEPVVDGDRVFGPRRERRQEQLRDPHPGGRGGPRGARPAADQPALRIRG